MRIYRQQFGWSEFVTNKQLGLKKYVPINFKAGDEPQTNEEYIDIEPSRFFHSLYKTKDGRVEVKTIIMEYTIVKAPLKEEKAKDIDINSDALPFY